MFLMQFAQILLHTDWTLTGVTMEIGVYYKKKLLQGLSYKYLFLRELRIYQISWSVCPLPTFPG